MNTDPFQLAHFLKQVNIPSLLAHFPLLSNKS